MKAFAIILFLGLPLFGAAHAQDSATNPVPPQATNGLATDSAAPGNGTNSIEVASQLPVNGPDTETVIPMIQFTDVPLTIAIDNLARQSGINYQIDVRCKPALAGSASQGIPEPTINLHLTNMKASEILRRILEVRGYALVNDPITTVTWITKKGLPPKTVNYELLAAGEAANPAIPLIQFNDVPMDTALDNLATQAGKDLFVSHDIVGADYEMLSMRWQNITARQAIIALCENYNFSLMTNNTPGVVYIVPRPKMK